MFPNTQPYKPVRTGSEQAPKMLTEETIGALVDTLKGEHRNLSICTTTTYSERSVPVNPVTLNKRIADKHCIRIDVT